MPRCTRLAWEALERIVADIVMINAAVLSTFVMRFLALFFQSRQDLVSLALVVDVFDASLYNYLNSAWMLTFVAVIVFWQSGFYTRGRSCSSRHRLIIVWQAVTMAFLVFGFLSVYLAITPPFPRSVLVGSYLLALLFVETAHLWAYLWYMPLPSASKIPTVSSPSHRKILVIGGAGYVGSALLPKLLERGYEVRLLDLLLYGHEPIRQVLGHPRLELVQADFRQVDKVVNAMRGIDAVIHLGGIVGDPACKLDEELTIEINLMATRMIAEVAKGSNVSRFIFASTCSVYGSSDQVLDERSELTPVSLYARSKIASERVLMCRADESFAPIILRFGTIYGLSGRTRFDLVVNLLTAKALIEGEITIYGGDQWRPLLHVDDAALALLQCLEAPLSLVRRQAFNVGSDEQNYTIRQIGEMVHRLVPNSQIVVKGMDQDVRNYRVNFNKIRQNVGFTPKWTVERGIEQVIEALRNGNIADYRDAKYSNVKFLSEEVLLTRIRCENGWAYEMLGETTPKLVTSVAA